MTMVRAACGVAVAALEKGEVLSKIRPTLKRLTEQEWTGNAGGRPVDGGPEGGDRMSDAAESKEGEFRRRLEQAVYEWPQFDLEGDAGDVNGGDLVEWFATWCEGARAAVFGHT